MLEEKQTVVSHKIMLNNRQGGSVSGVKDVTSFDEKEIVLFTEFGKLLLRGDKLHVSRLDLTKGEVELAGRVDSLQYVQKNVSPAQPLWKRLFQ